MKCCFFLAINKKARTVVGRGEEDPLCDPGSELPRTGGEHESSARIISGMPKRKEEVSSPDIFARNVCVSAKWSGTDGSNQWWQYAV